MYVKDTKFRAIQLIRILRSRFTGSSFAWGVWMEAYVLVDVHYFIPCFQLKIEIRMN